MLGKRISALVAVLLLAVNLRPVSAQEPTVKSIPIYGLFFSSQLSPDGKTLALAEDGNYRNWEVNPRYVPIRLLNLETGTLTGLIGAADYALGVAFSPDGTKLAAAYGAGYIYVWDLASGSVVQQLSMPPLRSARLVFLPDNQTLVVVTGVFRFEIWLWDTGTGYVKAIYTHHGANYSELLNQLWPDGVGAIALAQDGTTLALATLTGQVVTWNLADGSETVLVPANYGPENPIEALAFTPDGSRLVCYYVDEEMLHVLDAANGQDLLSLPVPNLTAFVLSPDGKTLVWADWKANALRVTGFDQPDKVQTIPLPTAEGYDLISSMGGLFFTPDGRQIVLSGYLSQSEDANAVVVVTLP